MPAIDASNATVESDTSVTCDVPDTAFGFGFTPGGLVQFQPEGASVWGEDGMPHGRAPVMHVRVGNASGGSWPTEASKLQYFG